VSDARFEAVHAQLPHLSREDALEAVHVFAAEHRLNDERTMELAQRWQSVDPYAADAWLRHQRGEVQRALGDGVVRERQLETEARQAEQVQNAVDAIEQLRRRHPRLAGNQRQVDLLHLAVEQLGPVMASAAASGELPQVLDETARVVEAVDGEQNVADFRNAFAREAGLRGGGRVASERFEDAHGRYELKAEHAPPASQPDAVARRLVRREAARAEHAAEVDVIRGAFADHFVQRENWGEENRRGAARAEQAAIETAALAKARRVQG
jgi:hypothetical protein